MLHTTVVDPSTTLLASSGDPRASGHDPGRAPDGVGAHEHVVVQPEGTGGPAAVALDGRALLAVGDVHLDHHRTGTGRSMFSHRRHVFRVQVGRVIILRHP